MLERPRENSLLVHFSRRPMKSKLKHGTRVKPKVENNTWKWKRLLEWLANRCGQHTNYGSFSVSYGVSLPPCRGFFYISNLLFVTVLRVLIEWPSIISFFFLYFTLEVIMLWKRVSSRTFLNPVLINKNKRAVTMTGFRNLIFASAEGLQMDSQRTKCHVIRNDCSLPICDWQQPNKYARALKRGNNMIQERPAFNSIFKPREW